VDHKITTLERAFQIARSGYASSVVEIKDALRKEGYSLEQISGRVLSKQLIAISAVARKDRAAPPKRRSPLGGPAPAGTADRSGP
jgi:hypothetical protein